MWSHELNKSSTTNNQCQKENINIQNLHFPYEYHFIVPGSPLPEAYHISRIPMDMNN